MTKRDKFRRDVTHYTDENERDVIGASHELTINNSGERDFLGIFLCVYIKESEALDPALNVFTTE